MINEELELNKATKKTIEMGSDIAEKLIIDAGNAYFINQIKINPNKFLIAAIAVASVRLCEAMPNSDLHLKN